MLEDDFERYKYSRVEVMLTRIVVSHASHFILLAALRWNVVAEQCLVVKTLLIRHTSKEVNWLSFAR
jgi:hypothetical protein